jgi:hypothetical protein
MMILLRARVMIRKSCLSRGMILLRARMMLTSNMLGFTGLLGIIASTRRRTQSSQRDMSSVRCLGHPEKGKPLEGAAGRRPRTILQRPLGKRS